MNTTPLRRLSSSILLVIPVVIAMFCLVHVAEAADSAVVYAYPSGDTSGMSAQLAPGIGGCTLGCATASLQLWGGLVVIRALDCGSAARSAVPLLPKT